VGRGGGNLADETIDLGLEFGGEESVVLTEITSMDTEDTY
jgi:hypothetical protein